MHGSLKLNLVLVQLRRGQSIMLPCTVSQEVAVGYLQNLRQCRVIQTATCLGQLVGYIFQWCSSSGVWSLWEHGQNVAFWTLVALHIDKEGKQCSKIWLKIMFRSHSPCLKRKVHKHYVVAAIRVFPVEAKTSHLNKCTIQRPKIKNVLNIFFFSLGDLRNAGLH